MLEWIKNRKKRPQSLFAGLSFLGPSLAGLAMFYIVPFGVVVYYSVINHPIQKQFVFLDNFKQILKNSAFLRAAKNTATFSAIAVPMAVIFALCLALLLESRIPFKSQFRTFFLSPLMVPVASVVLIWQVIFSYNGVFNELITSLGYAKIDWFQSKYSLIVVIILFLWKNLGYNMILFMAALNNIPQDLLEVAMIEGAGPVYRFFSVKLRYLSPTILFVSVLSLINSFKVFREVYLLTSDYPYETLYLLQHYMNNMFKSVDYQKLCAAAILMAIVMVIIIGILFTVENRFGKDVEG